MTELRSQFLTGCGLCTIREVSKHCFMQHCYLQHL